MSSRGSGRSRGVPSDSLWNHFGAEDLERQVEKLTLLCRAMWSLMRERSRITERDLARRMTELELQERNGRLTARARKCQACGHIVASRRERCLYCGDRRLMDIKC